MTTRAGWISRLMVSTVCSFAALGASAQQTIKIGEINSYKAQPAFLGPYKNGWNLALDETGHPNIGPFRCGGLVMIHSKTNEITRSGLYWAFAHYSRAVRRGARRIESEGSVERVSHVAFANLEGSTVLVLTNGGEETRTVVRLGSHQIEVALPARSISSFTWRG